MPNHTKCLQLFWAWPPVIRPVSWVRQNFWTSAMLLFVVLFYSFLILMEHNTKDEGEEAQARTHKSEVVKELKHKEKVMQERLKERPILSASLSLGFLSLLLSGLILDIALVRKKWLGRPWVEKALPFLEVRWDLKAVFQSLIFLLFIEAVLFLIHIIWVAMGWEPMSSDYYLLIHSLIRNFAVALFVLFLVRMRFGQGVRELGFTTNEFWVRVREGFVGYIAVLPPLVCVFLLLAFGMRLFSYEPEPQNVVQIFLKESSGGYLAAFTLFVALVGPILEEVFFRGFAFQALRKKWGVWPAAFVTSAVFAAFHLNAIAFLPILGLGLFLTYLYQATGSLVAPISAHILHNTLMVAMTLGFKSLTS